MISATTTNFVFFFTALAGLYLQACFFLHFGRPRLPGVLVFCVLVDLGAPSFSILPGPGRLGPKTGKKKATLDSNTAASTKKTQTANANKMQQRKRKQQMQKNAK